MKFQFSSLPLSKTQKTGLDEGTLNSLQAVLLPADFKFSNKIFHKHHQGVKITDEVLVKTVLQRLSSAKSWYSTFASVRM